MQPCRKISSKIKAVHENSEEHLDLINPALLQNSFLEDDH